jgi:nucleoside-diphosphate-sugar epimerase
MGVGPSALADLGVSRALRVLVTGHDGYLGSVLAPALAQAGHEVVGLDSSLFADCVLGPPPAAVPAHRVDIRDMNKEHVRGFDAVVHLAGLSNDALGNVAPAVTEEINHHASVRLARLAREAGVRRFLFSSSCSIYGVTDADEHVDESAQLRPLTPYAEAKARVEADLHDLADDDFSPVYLRNATVYGFAPRLRLDLVLNNLVAWAHLTGEVRVLSDGTPWRPLVHVADVASAFAAALEAERDTVHDEAYNVGSAADNYRIGELAQVVGEVVPECRVVITGETGPDARSYRVDFSKLERRLPAFRPAWNVRVGAAELRDAFIRFGLERRHLDRTFTRLAWLKELAEQGRLGPDLRPRNQQAAAPAAGE